MHRILLVLLGGGGAAIFSFALQISLSHLLSVDDFGVYVAMSAVIVCAIPFFSQGVSGLFLRRSSIVGGGHINFRGGYLAAIIVSSLIGYFFVACYAFLNVESNFACFLLLGTFIFSSSIQYFGVAQSQVLKRALELLVCQTTLSAMRFTFVFVLFFYDSVALIDVAWMLFLGNSLAVILLCVRLRVCFDEINFSPYRSIVKKITDSLGYSVNASVNVLQIQVAVLIVSVLYGATEAAYYASAITIMNALLLMPSVVFSNYLLHRYNCLLVATPNSLLPLKHSIYALAAGAIAGAVLFYGFDALFSRIYPTEYSSGVAGLMSFLSLSVVVKYFSTGMGSALLSEKSVRSKVVISFCGLGVQILVSVHYAGSGFESVAYGYLVGEILVAIGYTLLFFKNRKEAQA
ncbi:MAG: hypothetical protein P1U35_13345 [Cycloclasticus sp.]|nr:hypothetical protein [Cycloclasticus sp.]